MRDFIQARCHDYHQHNSVHYQSTDGIYLWANFYLWPNHLTLNYIIIITIITVQQSMKNKTENSLKASPSNVLVQAFVNKSSTVSTPLCLCVIGKIHLKHFSTVSKGKGSLMLETSVGFQSWSRFSAVSPQVTEAINPAVCHYSPSGQ